MDIKVQALHEAINNLNRNLTNPLYHDVIKKIIEESGLEFKTEDLAILQSVDVEAVISFASFRVSELQKERITLARAGKLATDNTQTIMEGNWLDIVEQLALPAQAMTALEEKLVKDHQIGAHVFHRDFVETIKYAFEYELKCIKGDLNPEICPSCLDRSLGKKERLCPTCTKKLTPEGYSLVGVFPLDQKALYAQMAAKLDIASKEVDLPEVDKFLFFTPADRMQEFIEFLHLVHEVTCQRQLTWPMPEDTRGTILSVAYINHKKP